MGSLSRECAPHGTGLLQRSAAQRSRSMTTVPNDYSEAWSKIEILGSTMIALAISGTFLASSETSADPSSSSSSFGFSYFAGSGGGGSGNGPSNNFFNSLFIAPLADEILPSQNDDRALQEQQQQPVGSFDVRTSSRAS